MTRPRNHRLFFPDKFTELVWENYLHCLKQRLVSGNSNFVLATFALGGENAHAAAASMSPYRVNTSPRRPPGGVESDYGYSTMTPHEDTDQQSQADTLVGASVSHPHNRDRYHPSLAIPRPAVGGGPPRITCNPLHSSSPNAGGITSKIVPPSGYWPGRSMAKRMAGYQFDVMHYLAPCR